MPTILLDANVLIALVVDEHVHHVHAEDMVRGIHETDFATCPITQGSLMRLLIREGQTAESARAVLQEVSSSARHEFWSDNASYCDIPIAGIIGHRQVTDAYLAHLARSYSARLATFDQALAKLHPDVADLIPTG